MEYVQYEHGGHANIHVEFFNKYYVIFSKYNFTKKMRQCSFVFKYYVVFKDILFFFKYFKFLNKYNR